MYRTILLLASLMVSIHTLAASSAAPNPPHNIGFYYGHEAPIGSLYAYDWLVLQPSQTTNARLDLLQKGNTRPIAYLSAGEMAFTDQAAQSLQQDWVLGENTAWKSYVLDIRNESVRDFMLEQVVAPAIARGFQGVFLDTLDSHLLTNEGRENPQAFAEAQGLLIATIRERFPDSRIIINRGFHLPESAHANVDALAFESWRNGYEAGGRRYYAVPEQDREWLASQLAHWREAHPELPIIAIDYAKTASNAVEKSEQLRQDGFIPYVSDHHLNRLGPTNPAVTKRHVLVYHDLPESQTDRSIVHRRLGIVLERLGLVPVYRSLEQPLPKEPVTDRFAGIVAWWETDVRKTRFCRWAGKAQSVDFPVVLFGLRPTASQCNKLMQSRRTSAPQGELQVSAGHPSMGNFESSRIPSAAFSPLPQPSAANSWLTVTDASGASFSPVYTHDEGAVATAGFIFENGPDDQAYWLFDPFSFLKEALNLSAFPAIDSTTESGRRILTAHIDGDGLVSRAELPGRPLGSEAIQQQILKVYDIPHTLSVIEAETSPKGLYPEVSAEAEASARSMFRMDLVEVASHSYSHPFFWGMLEGGTDTAAKLDETLYGYSMEVPRYTPHVDREINDSIAYINRRLAPQDKPASVFLWTGDARPGPEALRAVRELGLVNVNGGDTHPLPFDSELAGVWPDARPIGDELQVYAPVMNENVYTNLWTGPFFGYRNVIESFKILESHNRLKPMGIYYHFYSGTKPEALQALKEIYDYALSQPVTPLYLSDYAKRVQGQYYSALLQPDDNSYRWRGIQPPSTVRISQNQYPDLTNSRGVAGYHDVGDVRFVHLSGSDPLLVLAPEPSPGPMLDSANAQLISWQRSRKNSHWSIQIEFKGYQPLEFSLSGTSECRVNGTRLIQETSNGLLHFQSDTQQAGRFDMECR
ncbi:endo alpha-1,4 polygalactosaminidase [Marinobacter litoralis]|uniref:endo alpha-1,4 polygalactosaminidase n=1 Tax=Marinobacter litoralis TaxID=187981 RepID=UPI0018EBD7A2|nr:endo alpha-1,4 polygalactosaminidase [Marinobacter litoralis]MBJ6136154.1 endo alpha-1,4 polygalactosaminidase [Marinobacter litoralis]